MKKNEGYLPRLARFAAASVAKAHPDKSKILDLLQTNARLTVTDLIIQVFGADPLKRCDFQSVTSGHLKDLKSVGLVKLEQTVCRFNLYVVNRAALSLFSDFEKRWSAVGDGRLPQRAIQHTGEPIVYSRLPAFAGAAMAMTKSKLNSSIVQLLTQAGEKGISVVGLHYKLRMQSVEEILKNPSASHSEDSESVQSTISFILRRLRSYHLVDCNQEGRFMIYRINQSAVDLLAQFEAEYASVVAAFHKDVWAEISIPIRVPTKNHTQV